MADTAKKTYLLFQPNYIATDIFSVFVYLHIYKKNMQTYFGFDNLAEKNIHTVFKGASKKTIEKLKSLSEWHIDYELKEITKVFSKQRSGISFETYFERASTRHLYNLILNVIAINKELQIYHRYLLSDKKNYKTALCHFLEEKALLSFKAIKKNKKIQLITYIHLSDEKIDIEEFHRYKFLIERDNKYHLLQYKDYQTLDWLEKIIAENDNGDQQFFMQQILPVLEQSNEVDKSELIQSVEITMQPILQIYLSEINNAFLMLTPQWNYDNFIIDNSEENNNSEFIRKDILYKIIRDKEAEKKLLDSYLLPLHPNFVKQRNGYFYLSFDDAKKKNWFLKTYQYFLSENISVTGMDMLRHFRYSAHAVATSFSIYKTEGALLFIKATVGFGEENIALTTIQKTLLNNQRFVLLKDNSIGVLPDEWIDEYALIFKHAKVNKDELQIPQWILVGLKELQSHKDLQLTISKDWWEKWQQWQSADTAVIKMPEAVKATLRPYQQKGFEWMVLLSEIGAGGCLADDMGLGKTLQTMTYIAHTQLQNPAAKHLIVAPLTLVANWRKEIEKFLPDFHSFVFYSNNKDVSAFLGKENTIVITSYGTMRSDENPLKAILWDTIVLDESHQVKNPAAQVTKAVNELSGKTKFALSGTPIMNNTFDLYSQLNYTLPGLFGSAEFFKKEYAIPIDRDNDADKINALKKMINPFVLRRTKQQVAKDLPEKTESILWCEMEPRQREVYDLIKSQIKDSVFLNLKKEGFAKAKFSILQGILKLRQICCHPALLKDIEDAATAPAIKIASLIEELTDKTIESKALVFSQFNGMLDKIGEALSENGISFVRLDGSTPLKEREQLVAAFQAENSSIQVFLLGLKAGNAGLNLTAATYVFLVDPWWNNAVEQQAIDRTHRIGQSKNIFSYKLICTNTIEEKITQLQQKKKRLSEELVTEEEGFVKQLTEEDIHFLFE